MNFKTNLIFLFIFSVSIYGQTYIDKLKDEKLSIDQIEAIAQKYFDKVGYGNEYKFYQRWLYTAKIDTDQKGYLIPNRDFVKALNDYNINRNFNNLLPVEQAVGWIDLGPDYWDNASSSGWNPGVGRITSLAFQNTNHFIVGSPTGGVWKTTDGGGNWSCLTDNLSNIDVWSLAINPVNYNQYFWGSNEGRIYKSDDAGVSWYLLNPNSLLGSSSYHRVNKILIHPNDSEIVYASVEGSGVYKSSDGGANWTKIHASSNSGYDVEFKPGDPNIVYATGNSFFISINNGQSFEKYENVDLTIENTTWSQEIVSGTNFWLFADTNQNNSITPRTGTGMGWYYAGNFNGEQSKLISRTIDLSTATNPFLQFSFTNVNWEGDIDELRWYYRVNESDNWMLGGEYLDENSTWSTTNIDLSQIYQNSTSFQIAFEGKSNYGRGVTIDDISIYDDNQQVYFEEGFEEYGTLSANNMQGGAKMMAVSPDAPQKIYILEENNGKFGGLYVSNDQGASFSKLDHANKNYFGYSSLADDNSGQAPRDMDITTNPNDANIIYMSGILSWYSSDGGNTFQISSQWVPQNAFNSNIGYCHADIDITEFVDGSLFVGSDGGVFKAESPNQISSSYYTDLSSGLAIRQFYKIGVSHSLTEVVSGGSQDNGTSLLKNGNWHDWLGADGMETFVDKNDTNIVYGTTQYGSLYRTVDGGQNYSSIASPAGKGGSENGANWIVPFEQDPSVQDKIYVAYDEVFSKESENPWVKISQTFNNNIDQLKIAPSNNLVMYLSINDALYKTSDGGVSDWELLSLPDGTGNINAIAIHMTNPSIIALAVSGTNKVIFSEDGGINWEVLNNSLPDFSASALVFYGDDLIVGMNYGVFYNSASNRSMWTSFSENLPNVRITELEINPSLNRLYAATYGRGLWAADLDNSALGADFEIIDKISVVQNPVVSELNVQISKPIRGTIKIYNSEGRVVYYSKTNVLKGIHKIPVEFLPSGMYVLRITTALKSRAIKFLKTNK